MKRVFYNGPATICEISKTRGIFTGITKCNPKDSYSEEIGAKIASLRADLELRKYDLAIIRDAAYLAKDMYIQTGTKLWEQWAQDAVRVEKKQLQHIKNIKNQLKELYNG